MDGVTNGFQQYGLPGLVIAALLWIAKLFVERLIQQYAELAKDFRTIVEKNTEAITKLTTTFDSLPCQQCPHVPAEAPLTRISRAN